MLEESRGAGTLPPTQSEAKPFQQPLNRRGQLQRHEQEQDAQRDGVERQVKGDAPMPSIAQNSELNHSLPVKPPCAAIANRESRMMSRIDVDAGGAGLNSVIRVTQRVALVSVETYAGRARLDPRRTVRVGDGPASFRSGKAGKTVNCVDYRRRPRRRERI